jgi:2-polyprenyl-3-methyl-5-hydroxy-6-metoxy-1,4-benzoquinol methylase
MSFLLPQRASQLREKMDDLDCDLNALNATYKHFQVINQVLSGWRTVYQKYLRPALTPHTSLLDIGCGGGDIIQKLALWARQDGLDVSFTGVDPDARALEYARSRPFPPNVRFLQTTSSDLLREGKEFDIVISNHLLHHLQNHEVMTLCKDSEKLTRKLVVHNDIRRSSVAYAGFSTTRLLFRNSFVTSDGLRSIRRSFTRSELAQLVPKNWRIELIIPYRNLLIYDKQVG